MCCVFHFSDPHEEDKMMVDGVMKLVTQQRSYVLCLSLFRSPRGRQDGGWCDEAGNTAATFIWWMV